MMKIYRKIILICPFVYGDKHISFFVVVYKKNGKKEIQNIPYSEECCLGPQVFEETLPVHKNRGAPDSLARTFTNNFNSILFFYELKQA